MIIVSKSAKELAKELAEVIAAEIQRQAGDQADCFDNLGDGESIIFMGNKPATINLVEIAEVATKAVLGQVVAAIHKFSGE